MKNNNKIVKEGKEKVKIRKKNDQNGNADLLTLNLID